MAAESFFNRWANRKAESSKDAPLAPAPAAEADTEHSADIAPPQARPMPTLEDVEKLTRDSDYAPFVASGVDETVKRSAMKKLFSDPHFNVMDGLDIYIGDYNKFEPIPPEMLALLNHAKALLDPLAQFDKPIMALAEKTVESGDPGAEGNAQAAAENHAEHQDKPEEIAGDPVSTNPEKTAPSSTDCAAPACPAREDDTEAGAALDQNDPVYRTDEHKI